ncbi:MAG: tetratricopeptide repeat protein [Candidatus Protochlamydia sp.]|nr:tetratricopeptide repeat protein [Candidatus Protochlamydia sp.]
MYNNDDFEKEYNKIIDTYIESEGLDDNPPNPFIPPQLRHSKLREEIKSQAQSKELSDYLNLALETLKTDGVCYVHNVDYESMMNQFSEANENLNKVDINHPLEQNYRHILHFSDSTMQSIFKIAQAEYSNNKFEESLSIFAFLSFLEPEDPDYWYRFGVLAHQLKRYEAALTSFTNSLSLDANFLEARIYTAYCHLKLGQLGEAKDDLDKIHELADSSTIDPIWSKMISELEAA